MKVLTKEHAEDIFMVLVAYAGANMQYLDDFVYHHTNGDVDEYRFQGEFGFGGKYWNKRNAISYYKEDWTDELDAKKKLVDEKLREVMWKHEIIRLRKEKNAVILAHYYQEPEIQDIADFVGDSLQLAQKAADTDADIIVLCGVHFMAETAKIINPGKTVLLPELEAGCSLADSCPPAEFKAFKDQYPGAMTVTYVNCSAEIKTLSDLVCTSSNAKQIIASIPEDKQIIFAPDKNLGKYLMKESGRDMILWEGACIVHEAFSIDKIIELHKKHPNAQIIAHPESEEHVLKVANYVGSTAGMIRYVEETDHDEFIVGTEAGILHEMQRRVPDKTLIPAPAHEDNTCACSECPYMKMNTMQKLYLCLRDGKPEVDLTEQVIEDARRPIEKMLEISEKAGL